MRNGSSTMGLQIIDCIPQGFKLDVEFEGLRNLVIILELLYEII